MAHNDYCIKEAEIAVLQTKQEEFEKSLDRIDRNTEKILKKLNNGINVALANVSELANENRESIKEIKESSGKPDKISIKTKIAIAAVIIPNIGIIITFLMLIFKPFAQLFGIEINIK